MKKQLTLGLPLRIAAIDAAIVTVALMLPAAAHAIGVGTRFLEPMRMALLAVVLLVPQRRNAYLVALALPWISCAFTGMPVVWMAAMMSAELAINAFVLYRLLDLKVFPGLAVIASIISAKTVYYAAKFLLIQIAIIPQMPVIGNMAATVVATVLLSLLFVCGSKLIKR